MPLKGGRLSPRQLLARLSFLEIVLRVVKVWWQGEGEEEKRTRRGGVVGFSFALGMGTWFLSESCLRMSSEGRSPFCLPPKSPAEHQLREGQQIRPSPSVVVGGDP